MKNMNFLVTGGAGFIGSNICRRLVKDGHKVRVVDNLSTGFIENLDDIRQDIELVIDDMGKKNIIPFLMNNIDVVLHQGAISSVPRSVDDPETTHINCVDATFNLLMGAKEAGIKRFVYAASSSAYGTGQSSWKTESQPTSPQSPYAVAKLVGEYYCKVLYEIYGLETISLRYFNVFGPYQNPKSQYAAAIPAFVTSILNDKSPKVYGDGEQSRDFTYIDNVVNANILAATVEKTQGEVINIACGAKVTVNEIIAIINYYLAKNISTNYVPERPGDVKHTLADIEKAKEVIGYEPTVSFKTGLMDTIEWYKNVVNKETI